MTELNRITGIVKGQYGEAIVLTIVDDNGTPIDISSYTTSKSVTIFNPASLTKKTYTATFVTTGTDGQIQFTPADGDIDSSGMWQGQVKLATGTAVVYSVLFEIEVIERIVL